ncbi:hypothetical protein HHK36_016193 [Tetracentron sinense]|uniref:Uncharacterized protein n=1 Tax=Tetracentron sinense TaxID=13715 RepID=A0A834YZ93_TETSI|nr:hypothetical protein HHK36_016193 [Tetracentron sinense]
MEADPLTLALADLQEAQIQIKDVKVETIPRSVRISHGENSFVFSIYIRKASRMGFAGHLQDFRRPLTGTHSIAEPCLGKDGERSHHLTNSISTKIEWKTGLCNPSDKTGAAESARHADHRSKDNLTNICMPRHRSEVQHQQKSKDEHWKGQDMLEPAPEGLEAVFNPRRGKGLNIAKIQNPKIPIWPGGEADERAKLQVCSSPLLRENISSGHVERSAIHQTHNPKEIKPRSSNTLETKALSPQPRPPYSHLGMRSLKKEDPFLLDPIFEHLGLFTFVPRKKTKAQKVLQMEKGKKTALGPPTGAEVGGGGENPSKNSPTLITRLRLDEERIMEKVRSNPLEEKEGIDELEGLFSSIIPPHETNYASVTLSEANPEVLVMLASYRVGEFLLEKALPSFQENDGGLVAGESLDVCSVEGSSEEEGLAATLVLQVSEEFSPMVQNSVQSSVRGGAIEPPESKWAEGNGEANWNLLSSPIPACFARVKAGICDKDQSMLTLGEEVFASSKQSQSEVKAKVPQLNARLVPEAECSSSHSMCFPVPTDPAIILRSSIAFSSLLLVSLLQLLAPNLVLPLLAPLGLAAALASKCPFFPR